MNNKHERRVKIFSVKPEFLVTLFGTFSGAPPQYLKMPRLEAGSVPEGAIVEQVWYDPARQTLRLSIWHDSFLPVDDGAMPPSCDCFNLCNVEWVENVAYSQSLIAETRVLLAERDKMHDQVQSLQDAIATLKEASTPAGGGR